MLTVAIATVATVVALPGGSRAVSAQGTVYTVTIENLTHGQPFTPPLLAAHGGGADIFEMGQAASPNCSKSLRTATSTPQSRCLRARRLLRPSSSAMAR